MGLCWGLLPVGCVQKEVTVRRLYKDVFFFLAFYAFMLERTAKSMKRGLEWGRDMQAMPYWFHLSAYSIICTPTKRHLNQMLEPPQLAPFGVKEASRSVSALSSFFWSLSKACDSRSLFNPTQRMLHDPSVYITLQFTITRDQEHKTLEILHLNKRLLLKGA